MVSVQYTHVTIPVDDVNEAAEFYSEVFGMDEIPAVKFDTPVRWMDCGGLQLHLLEVDGGGSGSGHFAVHVDDFESFYQSAMDNDQVSFHTLRAQGGSEGEKEDPSVLYLENGTVQFYIRDPFGNLIEINYPDVEDLDRDIVRNIVKRPDVGTDSPPEADIYGTYGLELNG